MCEVVMREKEVKTWSPDLPIFKAPCQCGKETFVRLDGGSEWVKIK